MTKFKTIFLLLLLSIIQNTFSQELTKGEIIGKAGIQRMLCMKMAKNYMSIGANIKPQDSAKELDDAASLFNENFNDLMIYAKTKETKDAITFVGNLWTKYREKITSSPNVDQSTEIINETNNLVNACNVVVDKFLISTNSKTAILPNICGKQRLFSQKLGMLYLAKIWRIPYPNLDKDLKETIANYENGLDSLLSANENTESIITILKLQQSEWVYLKKSFDTENKSNIMPASVYNSTNLMTRNFDKATSLYEKLVLN